MRRSTAAAKARAAQAPPLAVEVAAVLDRYRPDMLSDEVWAAVRDLHREVIARARVATAASAVKARAVLAGYLGWRHEQGLTPTVAAACTIAGVDAYFIRGMADFSLKSRNDYRARLNTIVRAANPGIDAPPRVSVGDQKIRPGYTPAEEAALRDVALRQSSPVMRRQVCAVVGFCGGAGAEPGALRNLRARHVTDLGDDGIAVEFPTDPVRRLMVRRAYEKVVRAAVEGRDPDDLLVGKDPNRRNVTGNVIENGDFFDDVVRLDASRLRTTWLTWLVHQPILLRVILDNLVKPSSIAWS